MEELFGVPMNSIMVGLLVILLPALALVVVMGWRNQVMVKLALRNIPRRRTQTALIVVGIMISTLIMAAAFGTGDTISYSIRNDAAKSLGAIDEVIISAGVAADDHFGGPSYMPYQTFIDLRDQVADWDVIDGLSPGIGEWAPASNTRTSLSEGRMRIVGVSPLTLDGFAPLTLTTGREAKLEDLAENEVYLNDEAANELEAVPGDEIRLIVAGEERLLLVRGIVKKGGLSGPDPALLLPLERAQAMLGRQDQINSIAVSNRGGVISGAQLGEQVTRRLRALFADRQVVSQLKDLLGQDRILQVLESRESSLTGELRSDISATRAELQRNDVSNDLVNLLADEQVVQEILDALESSDFVDEERRAVTLFANLGEFRVVDIKRQVLELADEIGSSVTSFFVVMGLFSIMVGVLLIFLIFVMLAAARRTEMGMARAVGAKRGHLVQMFVFEGAAYAVLSGAVGVFLGLAASALIVVIANRIFAGGGGDAADFQLTRHFEVRSAVVAYSLGMVITLVTVAFSAYRVSRMNIVAAVRDLPAPVSSGGIEWREVLLAPLGAARRSGRLYRQSLLALASMRPDLAMGYFIPGTWNVLVLPIVLCGTLFQILWQIGWRQFQRGWFALLLGVLITWAGVANDEAAPFRIGISLVIAGLGLTMRSVLGLTSLRLETRTRIAYTFIGLLMLAFWIVPFDWLRAVAGDLEGGIEMFFISGIAMVAAAVWTVMYNADLLLWLLTFLSRPIGRMRPALVTAVAYPMSAKFRTGLTLAMFALVIFTLIVMSILTRAFSTATADVQTVSGGWDIQGEVNFNTPIPDIRKALEEHPALSLDQFEAVGGYTAIPNIGARQIGADNQRWLGYALRAADDEFLASTQGKLRLVAEGFGDTDQEVWQAMIADPQLAIVDALAVPSRGGFGDDEVPFQMESPSYEDERMDPVDVEIREPRTGQVVRFKVIGVLDRAVDAFGGLGVGMFVSRSALEAVVPFDIPTTTYRFRVAQGMDLTRTARDIEAAFRDHGMETEVLEELIAGEAAANRAFNYLFTGFMGLGLLVGIAALGVVSLRAVVERRQQIAVQRAIGYRRSMVRWSFLLESSFVVLLGVAIGVSLGTVISYNIVNDIKDNVESIKFAFPWTQIIIIIALAYLFSVATTYLPARQASRIYPAEALRYE